MPLNINPKLIQAAINIKLALEKMRPTSKRYWPLLRDLVRIKNQFNNEEMRVYMERVRR